MVNESGAICTETEITAETQREIMRGQIIRFIALCVISVALSALYFVLLAVLKPFPEVLHVLLIFIILAVLSVMYLVAVAVNLKKMKLIKQIAHIEIYADRVTERLSVNGEEVAGTRTYYRDLLKRKETKNYIVMYKTANNAHIVKKSNLTPAELETLKGILGLGGLNGNR